MNGKETSLQSNPNQWLHIWFARGRKIIQIVDRFTLQHFVNQKHFSGWKMKAMTLKEVVLKVKIL